MEIQRNEENLAWLEAKHEYYEESNFISQMCLDFYYGGNDVIQKARLYLPKHISETEDSYNSRLKRIYYDNKIGGTVRSLANFIFNSPNIHRKEALLNGINLADSFLDDVDGMGNNINIFMKNRAIISWVAGLDFIYIEPPNIFDLKDNDININIGDVLRLGAIPIFKNIPKANITNWTINEKGLFDSVVIFYEVANSPKINNIKSQMKKKIYLVWEKIDSNFCQWTKYDENGNMINEPILVPIPEIPIVPIYAMRKDTLYGKSLIEDAVWMAKAKFDLDSRRYDFLHYSATNMIFIPTRNEEEANQIKNLKRGNSYFLTYPAESAPPFILTPNQSPYESLLREDDRLTRGIYLSLKQRLQELSNLAVAQSGESKREDFKITEAEIVALAKQIEEAENYAYYFQSLWLTGDSQRASELQIRVSYPNSFDISTLNDKINEIMELESAGFGKTFINEKKKIIIMNDPIWKSIYNPIQEEILEEMEKKNSPESMMAGLEKVQDEIKESEKNMEMAEIEI